MTIDFGLTELDRADLHARLVSWFGDERQAFLVSHLAPVVDRIKSEACAQAAAEAQWNALEMSRRADIAERRAEEAEFHVEQLRDARARAEAELERLKAAADLVGHQAACLVDPCDCWMYHLAPLLEYEPPRWAKVAEGKQGPEGDAWQVTLFEEAACDHQWLDRPESDTVACDLCGAER